jgi:hypothetical protein
VTAMTTPTRETWPYGQPYRDVTPKTLPGRVCPTHHTPLDGGPIQYRCPHGHAVVAADLNNEYQPWAAS